MAQKLKLRELGMDTMERLYYERKSERQKAYAAKQKKARMKKGVSAKRTQREQTYDTFGQTPEQSIYNMC